MLELKNIKKTYISGNEKVEALKGINLKFRKAEFVSILGQSGCGKTTLLNIIGGLDRYTSGDLIIDGKSTKHFKDRDWDAYRNFKVGFIFQSYNLIGHQTVLSNVELALTIGGISKKERRERAIKALEEVGLKDQINKKPNQLSGGQMQRVAIARALVNDPEIILADEPTGALDTKTSIQVMEILKQISKDKLIIMVTHNPELANKYSNRIIKILDGKIIEDSNSVENVENDKIEHRAKIGRTSMKFWTAFRLSLNNLLTKKGRTILVAFAGSIGIIGIALVLAVSNGFQAYVDHIQEEALTSYPLTIMQESYDITSMLLSLTSESEQKENPGQVEEKQYISDMLSSLSTNDLKSFDKFMDDNYKNIDNDIANIKYSYSVEPLIYTTDVSGKIVKLNPSNLFTSMMGGSGMMSSYSAMSSIYSQMIDNKELLDNSYDILAGRWPEKYNEMVIVLSEKNTISDLLVYSLGLRENDELTDMVKNIMAGEKVDLNNEPLTFSYEDLMNVKLKLLMPVDLYKYNSKYNIYEDMTENEEFFEDVYNKADELKIVGVVSSKPGTTSMALNPGVAYTSDLIKHIIDYSGKSEIVKKQLENKEVNVISGKRFDSKEEGLGLNFQDFISIDGNKIQSAFNMKIDQNSIQSKTTNYMNDISNAIKINNGPAKNMFNNNLNVLANGLFNSITDTVSLSNLDSAVEAYLNTQEANSILSSIEKEYVIPKDASKTTYSGLLKTLLQVYINAYYAVDPTLTENKENMVAKIIPEMASGVISEFTSSAPVLGVSETMANAMTEAKMKKEILTKVGELMSNLTSDFSSGFNVDASKMASAFKFKMTEEELTRIISSMMNKKEITAKTNLITLGYQDIEEPTYISYYFKNFEGKENFLKFIEKYNKEMEENGEEDKVINYTDTTGILINSVKTIVNAVTYVLIAFISISLVVSSIMIGIITYISVYERTKEIGILRAIGASKRNISSIFNAETFIIGLLSGLFGIGITYLLLIPINAALHHFAGDIPLTATFYIKNAIILVVLSIILTLIGGLIPARAASKKDPVIALRTE